MQGVSKVGVALCLITCVWEAASDKYYSSFYKTVLNSTQVAAYTSNGTLANCTIVVKACNSSEPRRIDGTCNNINHPPSGATRSTQSTHLPKVFNRTTSTLFDPRLSASGEPLLPARYIRDALIADGVVEDSYFTQCVTHFLVFFATDMTNTKDTTNYVSWRPFCCEEAGKSDHMCAPNLIPKNDYVHRFTNITCLNMTRQLTFQTSGCVANTTAPSRIVDATPLLDMSPIYGNVEEPARRTYANGTLATETVDDRVFPISSGINLLLGVNFFPIIFFWRYHNFIAGKLLEVNPSWTDNQTFSAAREINIAIENQIYYYELLPEMMGSDNLIADGIISDSTDFRDDYNSSLVPQVWEETLISLRLIHKMQDGNLKLYSTNGTFLNQTFPMVDLTSNTAILKKNQTMDYATQAFFRQAAGKLNDSIADPDILNRGLGSLQKAMDIMTNDLAKNRYAGLQGYTEYRNLCFDDDITSFDDLEDIMSPEAISALERVYADVTDIDLLAGLWTENMMDSARVPPTFYCLLAKQLLHNMQSDRHWFERDNRPNAFTADQLAEIRGMSMSRLLCDVGDGVSEIQPKAFVLPGSDNEIVSCDEIPSMDFSAWADC